MREISTYDFFKIYQTQDNLKIIDVRDPYEFDRYHINKSMNIPLTLLFDRHFLFMNKKHSYYIICRNGSKSQSACSYLTEHGYDVTNVVGGIDRWQGSFVMGSRRAV